MALPSLPDARPDLALVLDAGGVLLTEPVPALLRALAQDARRPLADVEAVFRTRFYDLLWAGRLPEEVFWAGLTRAVGAAGDPAGYRKLFLDLLVPLPAAARVPSWAQRSRVFVLSNHLSAWLLPRLDAAGVAAVAEEIWVSDTTGLVKPDPAAFAFLVQRLPVPPARALLVDDRPYNVRGSRDAGVPALLADAAGGWVARVERWLAAPDAAVGDARDETI